MQIIENRKAHRWARLLEQANSATKDDASSGPTKTSLQGMWGMMGSLMASFSPASLPSSVGPIDRDHSHLFPQVLSTGTGTGPSMQHVGAGSKVTPPRLPPRPRPQMSAEGGESEAHPNHKAHTRSTLPGKAGAAPSHIVRSRKDGKTRAVPPFEMPEEDMPSISSTATRGFA